MKKIIPIVGVGAAVVIGFGYFTLFSTPAIDNLEGISEGQQELNTGEATVESEELGPVSGEGTLKSLMVMGNDVECTILFSESEEGVGVEGTYFVAGENVRGDFLTQSPDFEGTVLSSLIVNKKVFYVWSEIEGEKYGAKMDFSTLDEQESSNQGVSMDDLVNYDCKPWKNVDNTIFEPPHDVLFRDMGDLIKGGMEDGTIYPEGNEFEY